jgi:hypothetical protein
MTKLEGDADKMAEVYYIYIIFNYNLTFNIVFKRDV